VVLRQTFVREHGEIAKELISIAPDYIWFPQNSVYTERLALYNTRPGGVHTILGEDQYIYYLS
jgi:hypothetical protein